MAFILNSRIKIGTYSFPGGVHELKINKSIYAFFDTAKLTMPGLGRVTNIKKVLDAVLPFVGLGSPQHVTKNLPNSSVKTALLFKEGDPVSIDLGYNGDYRNEFRGFVRRVNLTTPMTIDLEGYAWQLRNKSFTGSFKTITLKELLTKLCKDTDIVLSPDIPDMVLNRFISPNKKRIDVLQYLQEKMLLTIYFADNVLYAGIEQGRITSNFKGIAERSLLSEVVYKIGHNCVTNQPDLKIRHADDCLVYVVCRASLQNGNHIKYATGDVNGDLYETKLPFIKDEETLRALGDARLRQLKYTGYSGSITGFLQPYALPGWKARIIDPKYDNARGGSYFVTGTEVTYGVKGARRRTSISYRLDAPQTT